MKAVPRTNRKTDLMLGGEIVLDELEQLDFNSDEFDISVDESQYRGTISLKQSGSSESSESSLAMMLVLGG